MKEIKEFKGKFSFLSNFEPFEVPYKYGIYTFRTNEHFYMAMKNKDPTYRAVIANIWSPAQAKKAGSQVKLQKNWEKIKEDVMLFGLRYKFSKQNPNLRQKLIETGSAKLIEGNWWNDKYWGFCLKTNQGKNRLGELLMQVRKEITGVKETQIPF